VDKERAYEIEKKALIELAGKIIKGVDGVHSVKRGFFGKNIQAKQTPEGIEMKIGLVVKRGASIPAVVEEIQEKLKQEIEQSLGIEVKKIDVVIKGIKLSK